MDLKLSDPMFFVANFREFHKYRDSIFATACRNLILKKQNQGLNSINGEAAIKKEGF